MTPGIDWALGVGREAGAGIAGGPADRGATPFGIAPGRTPARPCLTGYHCFAEAWEAIITRMGEGPPLHDSVTSWTRRG